MTPSSFKYLSTWISLIIAVLSSVVLFYLSINNESVAINRFILTIIAWALLTGSVIFLFLKASSKDVREEEISTSSPEKKSFKTSKTVKADKLDIPSLANKIVRKAGKAEKPGALGKQLLNVCVKELEIMAGVFYYADENNVFKPEASYANPNPDVPYSFKPGEGITGQVAKNKQVMVIRKIPDEHAEVFSGLGSAKPSYIALIPFVINDQTKAVLEVAGFRWHNEALEQLFQIVARDLGLVLKEKNSVEKEQ